MSMNNYGSWESGVVSSAKAAESEASLVGDIDHVGW